MKTFRFESIWLLSRKEAKARHETFHHKKNLILGRNHTGKSSLIKMLFLTLGAKPQGKLANWDDYTFSLVEFSVDGRRFRALYHKDKRALFNEHDQILLATTRHSEWSQTFSNITGFNLTVKDQQSESVQADPRCFFTPFYINQDGSWQATWDTFDGIKQYQSPISSILEYFTGIKPPEYYKLRAERDREQEAIEALSKEQRFLEKARERVSKTLPLTGPKVNGENFELEIASLTLAVTELNRRQEIIRDRAVREYEQADNLVLQGELAEAALKTYEEDANYLGSKQRGKLICPLCKAEHAESFLDILTYAEDARVLRDLSSRLGDDAVEIQKQLSKTQAELRSLDAHYKGVSQILDTRRGELQFRQVADSMGAERAFRAFEEESMALQKDIGQRAGLMVSLKDRMDKLTNRTRAADILNSFRQFYAAAQNALNLPSSSTDKLKITARPKLSGSGGPRAILAYYAALWATCYGEYKSFSIPLIIDAPNQQGQDDINLPAVIKFIANNLPDTQVIVASEIDTNATFDKFVNLEKPYGLLQTEDFQDAEKVITPLEKIMFDELTKRLKQST